MANDLPALTRRMTDAELRERMAAILARVMALMLDDQLTLTVLTFYGSHYAALNDEIARRSQWN
jgi:hypothetical protein